MPTSGVGRDDLGYFTELANQQGNEPRRIIALKTKRLLHIHTQSIPVASDKLLYLERLALVGATCQP